MLRAVKDLSPFSEVKLTYSLIQPENLFTDISA